MNVHKNAKLTAAGRADLVRRVLEGGQLPKAVATAFGVDPKTVSKWVARFVAEGPAGLEDRSSRPHRMPRATPPDRAERVIALRRERLTGQRIARETGISPATVSRVLRRAGLSRMRDLEPPRPVVRYERDHPGELIHIDIKKLARFEKVGPRITGQRTADSKSRGAGWEYVHVCVDDNSRTSFSQVLEDQTARSAVAFLQAAIVYYASLGIQVRAVMTDNGACYISKAFAKARKALGLKHIRTKPYTPQTNGKAERFIQTALREWAYAKAYASSDERNQHLPGWLHQYNWHRPHSGIGSITPINRLTLDADNLMRLHT